MNDKFDHIRQLYRESYEVNGDSPSSLLTPKGRNELRFRAVAPLIDGPGASILDYGCGLGYLYDYLSALDPSIKYTGVDILPEFIQACAEKYPTATFSQISAHEDVSGTYDIVFSSGVFNLATHDDPKDSKNYAFERLEHLFGLTRKVLVCDFLSTLVDFVQPGAQHFSIAEISSFVTAKLGRKFQIRHDLLPYEQTLIVFKNDGIVRPQNIYVEDA